MTTDPMTDSARIVEWHDREWPSPDGTPAERTRVALKLAEEVGELAGAIVKHEQGRTDRAWLEEARLELGDVLIVAAVLADRIGTTLEEALADRWATVQHRRGATYR